MLVVGEEPLEGALEEGSRLIDEVDEETGEDGVSGDVELTLAFFDEGGLK